MLRDGFSLFSDLPGFQAPHGGVIPPDAHVTNLKPDLFLINVATRVIVFFELTCPWDSNIQRSHEYKERKYAPLIADLSRRNKVYNYSVEVSARGQISKDNRARLKSFLYNCCDAPRNSIKSLTRICSKASLLSSFSLFSARKEPSWSTPNPLTVRWPLFCLTNYFLVRTALLSCDYYLFGHTLQWYCIEPIVSFWCFSNSINFLSCVFVANAIVYFVEIYVFHHRWLSSSMSHCLIK